MNLLEMNIDKTVPVPLYYQLKSLILSEIKKGNLKEGDCLPTEMQMVEHFHVSRSTVRQAISDLSKEGWLERIASKGTFVTNNTSHSENFTVLLSLFISRSADRIKHLLLSCLIFR